jgi:hypothetical protein
MENNILYSQNPSDIIENADIISQLPSDKTQPSHNELKIINSLFKNNNLMTSLFIEVKDSFLVGILVVLFSLSQVDYFIKSFLPITEKSPYILILIKAISAMILFWLIKYFYLSRKDYQIHT